ncbi:MAG TPA: hypothetical protein VGN00_13755 [Puia sp.]|jgi:hypothetical protein
MSEDLTPLVKSELGAILGKRIGLSGPTSPFQFQSRNVLDKFILSDVIIQRPGSYVADLVFSNCSFIKEVAVGDAQRARRIVFENCKFFAPVSIDSTENCILLGKNEFFEQCKIGLGRARPLENIIAHKDLEITAEYPTLGLAKICNINQETTNLEPSMVIRVTNGMLHFENVYLGKVFCSTQNVSTVTIVQSEMQSFEMAFGGPMTFASENSKIGKLNTTSLCGAGGKIELSDSRFRELTIEDSDFKRLDIIGGTIHNLLLCGVLEKDKYVTVSSVELNELLFKNFYNNGVLSFRDVCIKEHGNFEIANSTLGKTDFIGCHFREALFVFLNSKLTEIFVAETEFPTTVAGIDKRRFEQAQLAFGQFRTAFDKQGDAVRALEYQSREIEAHYQTIPSFWTRRFPFVELTKLNLGLNKVSNNFGREWGRALVFSLAIGIFFFVTLLCSTKPSTSANTLPRGGVILISFFRFMNPLRFFDLETLFIIDGQSAYVKVTAASYAMDFLGRIGLAYGYYQTIQAFRRFGRK